MEMKRQDFSFELPQELIAQDPLKDRSSSRLLVLDKETGEVSHHVFRDIIDSRPPDRIQGRNRCKNRDPAAETEIGSGVGDAGEAWEKSKAGS